MAAVSFGTLMTPGKHNVDPADALQFTLLQWLVDYYPQGKTSVESRFNIPGRVAWATMEAPGFINLLYIMFTLPKQNGIESLPLGNWIMAGLFVWHSLPRSGC